MNMKKKAASLFLCLAMLLPAGVPAFAADNADILYKAAEEKTAALEAGDASMRMAVTLAADGEELSYSMEMKQQMIPGKFPNEIQSKQVIMVESEGKQQTVETYRKDGWQYTHVPGVRVKKELECADVSEQMMTGEIVIPLAGEEMMGSVTMQAQGTDTYFQYHPDLQKMQEMIWETMYGRYVDIMEEEDLTESIKIHDFSGYAIVNSQGYLTSQNLFFSCTVTDGSDSMDVGLEFHTLVSNPGEEPQIEFPGFSCYEEVESMSSLSPFI